MTGPARARLARRLALNALAVGVVVGVLLSGWQIAADYLGQRHQVKETVTQVLAMSRASAAKAAYEIDHNLAASVVQGLMEYRPISHARVVDDFGTVLAAQTRPVEPDAWDWLGGLFFPLEAEFSLPLTHGNPGLLVGRLEVTADGRTLAWSFLRRAGFTLVAVLIYTLVMVGLLVFFFHLWITRPLVKISHDLAQVDPDFPGQRPVPMPQAHQDDELGQLVAGLNQVLQRLEQSLEESRSAERRRAESEERFREMAENIQEVFWLADPATEDILYVSPAFEKIWGHSLESLRDDPQLWIKAVHPADRPKVETVTRELASGVGSDVEYRVLRPDGSQRWVHDRAFPVWGEQGEIRRVAGIAVDVTDRREAEEALARSARRVSAQLAELDQIYRFAPAGLAVLDPGLRVVRINRLLSELSRVPAEEQAGRNLAELFPGLAEPLLAAAGKALKECRSVLNVELSGRGPDNPGRVRHFLASFLPFRDSEGRMLGIIAAVLEITERKEAEEHRRRLEAQMQQAQKLESLGVLAGGIAHDFNNLLMGVMGNAGLALMEMAPDDTARPWVEQVERAAQRLAELTNQLLAYSGKGRFVTERMDLGELVREMADLLGAVVSKKARMKFNLSVQPALVEGDPTQLRQVVMNLITNASEALGSGEGAITITTGLVEADAAYLAGGYLENPPPPGRYAFMEVADTGCGMEPATKARVFEPFFTTKFTGRGMGLGAVLGIVRSHGGAVRVWSHPGEGSIFRVLIPQAAPPGEHHAVAAAAPPGQATLEGVTVLVVDDEDVVRDMTKSGLEYFGLKVITAADGQSGLEAFQRHRDEIDVVLLDMTMPRMDGAQVFAALRDMGISAPVILISGFSESDATRRFAGKGLAGFLQKPFRPTQLVDKVAQVLGREEARGGAGERPA